MNLELRSRNGVVAAEVWLAQGIPETRRAGEHWQDADADVGRAELSAKSKNGSVTTASQWYVTVLHHPPTVTRATLLLHPPPPSLITVTNT